MVVGWKNELFGNTVKVGGLKVVLGDLLALGLRLDITLERFHALGREWKGALDGEIVCIGSLEAREGREGGWRLSVVDELSGGPCDLLEHFFFRVLDVERVIRVIDCAGVLSFSERGFFFFFVRVGLLPR